MDADTCLLFMGDEGSQTAEMSSSLNTANDDLDSRGTFDAATPIILWKHAGTEVAIEQQANVLSDTAALVWMETLVACHWLAKTERVTSSVPPLGAALDLGAGTGFLGCWVSLHGLCTTMTISDRPIRMPYIRRNIDRNHLASPKTTALGLNWGDVKAARALRNKFDVIFASSLIYDPGNHEALIATLEALAAPRILLVFARRHEAHEESFLNLLRKNYETELKLREEEPLRGNEVFIFDCSHRDSAATPAHRSHK